MILAKVPGAQSFRWLGRQHDLRRVFDASAIVVYENEEVVPHAYEPSQAPRLPGLGRRGGNSATGPPH